MRRNSKRKSLLHSAIRRTNRTDEKALGKIVLGVLVAVAATALAVGATACVRAMRATWLEQCVITDPARQVEVTTGSHVKRSVILEGFGLKEGANLAQIDFAARRDELMRKVPNIRSLSVSRRLPDAVEISVAEREPLAKVEVKGAKGQSGLVVDSDGVVFRRRGGSTDLLPKIVEARQPGTQPGKSLAGMARSALDLVALCREDAFAGFNVIAVDCSHQDYLLAVLANYQRAIISWDGIESPDAVSRENMRERVGRLRHCVLSGVATRGKIWNATQPGHITCDTKEPIP